MCAYIEGRSGLSTDGWLKNREAIERPESPPFGMGKCRNFQWCDDYLARAILLMAQSREAGYQMGTLATRGNRMFCYMGGSSVRE